MPNTIASRSMPKTLMMIECPRRKRSPSITDDAVAALVTTTGGAAAIAANASRAMQYVPTSAA